MSSFLAQAINSTSSNAVNNMHTCFPALVVAYNESEHTATLQPLYKYENGESYPQVQQVPVARWRYKIMQNKHITESETSSYTGAGSPHDHHYTWSDSGGSGSTSTESSHAHTFPHKHPIEFEEIIEEVKLLLYPGDLVLCVCSERSIDSINSRQVHDPQSKRKFDISDACVVCIL